MFICRIATMTVHQARFSSQVDISIYKIDAL